MFQDMIDELHGSIPKIPVDYASTLINRAWRDLRRQNLWSFLLWEGNWISPPIINAGTVTTVQGARTVTLDTTAAAAVIAGSLAPTILTQRQFRQGISTIYNIWGFDGVDTLTLDRAYADTAGSGLPYSIFQCYYPAPMKDFLGWVEPGGVRDMRNFIALNTSLTRAELNRRDPQRTWYYFPTDVVYYQQDQNPDSDTYGFPCFELWGSPQYNLVYQLYGMRRGVDLSDPEDELPPAIGEDCLMALARKYGYEWAEANKDNTGPRGSSPDYRFLSRQAMDDYTRLFRSYRKDDRETVDNFFAIREIRGSNKLFSYYSTLSGTAFPGLAI